MVNAFTQIKRLWFPQRLDNDSDEFHFLQALADFCRFHKIGGEYCTNMLEESRSDSNASVTQMFMNPNVWDDVEPVLRYLMLNHYDTIASFHKTENEMRVNHGFVSELVET